MKKTSLLSAVTVVAMMGGAQAADLIVDVPPEPSPLLDNTPIADNVGVWSTQFNIGFGYLSTSAHSGSVDVTKKGNQTIESRSYTDISVPTINVGFTKTRDWNDKFGIFASFGGFYGIGHGDSVTNTTTTTKTCSCNPLTVENDTSSEDVSVYGLTAAIGPTFKVGHADVKVGPSLRYLNVSGGNFDGGVFGGVTAAVKVAEYNGWNVDVNGSYETELSADNFDDLYTIGLGVSKQF